MMQKIQLCTTGCFVFIHKLNKPYVRVIPHVPLKTTQCLLFVSGLLSLVFHSGLSHFIKWSAHRSQIGSNLWFIAICISLINFISLNSTMNHIFTVNIAAPLVAGGYTQPSFFLNPSWKIFTHCDSSPSCGNEKIKERLKEKEWRKRGWPDLKPWRWLVLSTKRGRLISQLPAVGFCAPEMDKNHSRIHN